MYGAMERRGGRGNPELLTAHTQSCEHAKFIWVVDVSAIVILALNMINL
jgi:hypothetical protein